MTSTVRPRRRRDRRATRLGQQGHHEEDDNLWEVSVAPIATLRPADNAGNVEQPSPEQEPSPETTAPDAPPPDHRDVRPAARGRNAWSHADHRFRPTGQHRLTSPGADLARLGAAAPEAPPSTGWWTLSGPTPRRTGCWGSAGPPSETCTSLPGSRQGGPRSPGESRRTLPTKPDRVACRLWDFQSALGDAARASPTSRPAPRCAERSTPTRATCWPAARTVGRTGPPRPPPTRRRRPSPPRRLEDHAGRPEAAVAVWSGSSTWTATPRSPTAG